jgi:hypothetical protein
MRILGDTPNTVARRNVMAFPPIQHYPLGFDFRFAIEADGA